MGFMKKGGVVSDTKKKQFKANQAGQKATNKKAMKVAKFIGKIVIPGAAAADVGVKIARKFKGDKYGDCANVIEDEENNIKTVTFSDDCKGKRGQVRSGSIIITYSETQGETGSFRQVTYDNFYLNGVKIEGNMVILWKTDIPASLNKLH